MNKILKNKKLCVAILVICILILVGVMIAVSVKGNKGDAESGKSDSKQEIIVHKSDENTVEEEADGGLTESDSEDGPVLDEDKMIDFNGSDTKAESAVENNKSGEAAKNEEAKNEEAEEGKKSNDKGSWGAFY